MNLRWFISSARRQAVTARKHYGRLLAARRDTLSPEANAAVGSALGELAAAMAAGDPGPIRLRIEELQVAAAKWISPYPHRLWRGYMEFLVVVMVLALGIRTFFLQPFTIPTGSMQPTLYGVTFTNLIHDSEDSVPRGWDRVWAWFAGMSYPRVVAKADGTIERLGQVTTFLRFNLKQSFWLGGVEHVVWFPPDVGDLGQGIAPMLSRSMWVTRQFYHQGDVIISLRRSTGDYLLADRLSYNFRKPARGDIIVFKTQGIAEAARRRYSIPDDEFYIKRLVGLPGEKVQIGNDHHLIIDGRRLDASTPHFGNLYSFDSHQPFRPGLYLGHLNGRMDPRHPLPAGFAPLFPDQKAVVGVGPGQCLAMGDNTLDSLDSRYWGQLSEDAIVGRSFFVFWPITKRFGWGNQ